MPFYRNTPVAIACPVCRSAAGRLLYTVDSQSAAQHYVLFETQPERHTALRRYIESLWKQNHCSVVSCEGCGFGFPDPYVAGDAGFFELAYQRSGYPGWKWEFERTLQVLQGLKRQGRLANGRLLEIGAGDGAFIKRIAPALLPRSSVVCTEYSSYGLEALGSYGITCVPKDIRDSAPEIEEGAFSAVCLFQVLQHMDGLDELFERFNEITEPAAHLFIAVPNRHRIEFNELHGSLLDLPPSHVGRWSRRAFETIGGRHGWSIRTYEIEPESSFSRITSYLAFKYLRRRQQKGSLANRIERLGRGAARRVLQAAAAGLYAFSSFGALRTLLSDPGLGESQWVHLEKEV